MSGVKLRLKLLALDNLIWVLIIVLFIINAFFVPKFFTYRNIINIFYHVSTLGLLILAQGIVLMVGELDLSVESNLAFGPGMAILICNALFPGIIPIVQILLTILISMIIGFFNGLLITKLRMNSLLETLASNIILRGFILLLVPFSLINLAPGYSYAGSARTFGNIPVAVIILLGTYLIFGLIMGKTRFGRFLVATGGNRKASYIAGVNVNNMTISAFVLSGLLAALAGLLAAGRQGSISNSMGSGLAIMSIAGAILGGVSLSGGRGTVFGMLGGALLLSMFSNFLNLLAVNVYLVNIIKGFLILFAIILDSTKVRLRAYILYKEKVNIMNKMKRPEYQLKEEAAD